MDASEPLIVGRDFFDRARQELTLDVPPALTDHAIKDFARGDLDLDPAEWEQAGVTATRPAAVLIPVVDHAEPGVLLTTRTSDLPSHANQIAFPGGKIDPTDASPLAAALARGARGDRARRRADRADRLSRSVSDLLRAFASCPSLARVIPNYQLRINASEVADAFEVPLSFVMDAANHRRASRDWKGVTRHYYEMPFGERYIWGVTAGILRNLYEKIYG